MSFSYNPVITSPLDELRLRIGDTVEANALFSDQELTFMLSDSAGVVLDAAIVAANSLVSRFARLADTTVESVSVSYSKLAENYRWVVQSLKDLKTSRKGSLKPIVTGQSISEMNTAERNTDRMPNAFTVDMDTNPPVRGNVFPNDQIG